MPTHQHDGAAAPGLVTPTSDNAPWQARVEGNGETDNPNCAELVDSRKRLLKLQAELALQRVELHELKSGALLAVGPGLKAHFGDLSAAQAWVRQRAASAGAGARFDVLRARLQAAGWVLTAGAAGDFTVSRWGQSRRLADVAALERFARQVGVRA